MPKIEAPGSNVTVSFPALIKSLKVQFFSLNYRSRINYITYASTCASSGYGPIPKMPFSLCSHTLTSGAVCSGTRVGIPIPKLTWYPSLSSLAARLAMICLGDSFEEDASEEVKATEEETIDLTDPPVEALTLAER